jgi:hypothetical protein
MSDFCGEVVIVREIVGGSMRYFDDDGVGSGVFLDLCLEVDGRAHDRRIAMTAEGAIAAWAVLSLSIRDLGLDLPEVIGVDG